MLIMSKHDWKSNKLEHLKKKVVAFNEENKLLYEEVHKQKDSNQKGEKEKVDLSMELSKTKAKLHQLEAVFKAKNVKWRKEIKQCQIRNPDKKSKVSLKRLMKKWKVLQNRYLKKMNRLIF